MWGIHSEVLHMDCVVVGSRRLMPPDALQPKAYYTNPGLFLVVPTCTARDPSSERRNYLREKWPMNFAWKCPTSTNIQASFTYRKSTTWDKRLYFPSEGRRAEDFSSWKIRRLRLGLNPRTWVRYTWMLTFCKIVLPLLRGPQSEACSLYVLVILA